MTHRLMSLLMIGAFAAMIATRNDRLKEEGAPSKSDGTTPASRFFRRDFPDLFDTVLSYIEDLPRPRERKQTMALSH